MSFSGFRQRGFTIVEVLITIGLLILVMFGIYGAYSLMIRLTTQSRAQTVALQIAQEKLEFVRNLAYDSVGVSGGIPAGVVAASESVTRGGLQFSISTTIRNIDDPFDGDATGSVPGKPVDTQPADYKRVEVRVACPACSKATPVILTSNVVPKGAESVANTGSLLVNVVGKSGQPIAQANVRVQNPTASPQVDFTDTTDASGKLLVAGAPAGAYRLTVTKSGYSSDRTYPLGDPKNPNPVKPDPVITGSSVEITLVIDQVSTMVVKTSNQLCEGIGYVSAHVQGQTLIGTNPDVPKTSLELATDSYIGSPVTNNATTSLSVTGSVYDATNLKAPAHVFVSGRYAYVTGHGNNRLTVVDVSNPSAPTVVGSVRDDTNLYGSFYAFVSGRYAYVSANSGNRLTVVDVSNPASPTVVGSVRDNTNLFLPYSVFVSGRYAYVAAYLGNRLTVVDVSNPSAPTVVGSVRDDTNLYGSFYAFVSGRYAYVSANPANRLTVVDVSNPSAPTVVGSVRDNTNLTNPQSVFVSGRYAYVAAYSGNRLTVVDVSSAASPTVVGSVNDATNLKGSASVFVSGRYAYVAAYSGNRLTAVDVSNPASLTVVGSVEDDTSLYLPQSVFVSGRYAYVAIPSGDRLTVVDLGQWVETPTAAGVWQKAVSNVEADSYSASLTPLQQYDVVGTIPMLPVNLLPNSNQDVSLILADKTAHNLRVAVRDSVTRLPLSGARVEIWKGGSLQTRETGKGYFIQTDWSGGSGQSTYGNLTRYWSDDGHVDVDSPPGLVKLRDSQLNGSLISSTIDFAQPINPSNILWNQTVQYIEAVPVTFQIATNNDNATWNFLGPDGTANTAYTSSGTSINPIHNGSRYLRYKFTLTKPQCQGACAASAPPTIHDVAVTFTEGCVPPGQAYFADLSVGQYALIVSRPGYQTFNGSVAVNGDTVFEVTLNP